MTDLHDIADLVEISSSGGTSLLLTITILLLLLVLAIALFFYFLRQKRLVAKPFPWSKDDALKELQTVILPLTQKEQARDFLLAVERLARRYTEVHFSISCKEKTIKELLERVVCKGDNEHVMLCKLLNLLIHYQGAKFADEVLTSEAYEAIYKTTKEIIETLPQESGQMSGMMIKQPRK